MKIILAANGHDANERVIAPSLQVGKTAVVPPKQNRQAPHPYVWELYKARRSIENFFAKLKQYGAIATRHDKTARSFLAAIYFASVIIWTD